MRNVKWIYIIFFPLMAACGAEKKPVQEESIVPLLKDPITATKIPSPTIAKSRTALYLDSLGLKDVQSADSGIIVKLSMPPQITLPVNYFTMI